MLELEKSLSAFDVHWDTKILRDEPRYIIEVESMRCGSCLTVVGSHAGSGVARAWAGSVAEAATRAATGDVLIVPLRDASVRARGVSVACDVGG